MTVDIQLLQGKIVKDPDQRPKNVLKLIEELALEILSEEELAVASGQNVKKGSEGKV